MVDKQKLIDEADKEGFSFTSQALQMLSKLEHPIQTAKHLVQLAKERKLKIAGGDVIRYGIKGKLPNALITSDDEDDNSIRLIRIERKLDDALKKVK